MNRRAFALFGSVGLIGLAAFTWWQSNRPQATSAVPNEVPTISDADFASLQQIVPPQAGEDLFATLPWETSLWTAREKAAKSGKPMLLWSMDGHPLGCG